MNYNDLKNQIKNIKRLKVESIGRSWDNNDIFSVSTFFDDRPWVIIQGAIHAREHLSTDFIVYLISVLDRNYDYYKSLSNFPNVCFIPMLNPDGVQIVHF